MKFFEFRQNQLVSFTRFLANGLRPAINPREHAANYYAEERTQS
jgi:hypothetical protein